MKRLLGRWYARLGRLLRKEGAVDLPSIGSNELLVSREEDMREGASSSESVSAWRRCFSGSTQLPERER